MATNSGIEWTDATWNCLAGCEAVSPGCAKCYAATMTRRLEAMGQADYTGLTTARHFNGKVRCLPHKLDVPLRWRKPRRVFVNSMSDLFHEDVPDRFIDEVFAVMALCPQHTFQVLTKRAERMCERIDGVFPNWIQHIASSMTGRPSKVDGITWPLPNVWLGVSAEDQQRADERIPWLLKTPAAVRFVSAEPLLGPIDFREIWLDSEMGSWTNPLIGSSNDGDSTYTYNQPRLDWIIVGGESGHGARPCNVEWIRSIVRQCQAAGVACFVKQLGSKPYVPASDSEPEDYPALKDRKGGDIDEFPEDLRVRQMPELSNA